jgi:hypothetical protein
MSAHRRLLLAFRALSTLLLLVACGDETRARRLEALPGGGFDEVCFDETCGGRLQTLSGRDLDEVIATRYARPVVPTDVSVWEERASVVRAFLRQEVRLASPRPAPDAISLGVRDLGAVTIEDLLVDGFEGMHIPAALYLPAGVSGRIPGVVLYVGHDGQGQSAGYIRALAWRFAEHGVAVLSMDWLGMGTRSTLEQNHILVGVRSLLAGLLPQTPLLEEPLLAFEYLSSRPEVDPNRMAVAGQSGGGVVSMHLAAMEPSVAAAVVVDIVNTSEYERHWRGGHP